MDTNLRLAGVIRESIVDGPGWRLVVFAQGCPHHCEGCQNPQTHDFTGGYDSTVQNILDAVKANKLLAGITLSGGEPFAQAKAMSKLAHEIHKIGLNVMAYSGWTFEQLF
ncbi:MAG: 4Fe-4S single cluster domain-containing protein, partial [Oscillospiraceae bacterium]